MVLFTLINFEEAMFEQIVILLAIIFIGFKIFGSGLETIYLSNKTQEEYLSRNQDDEEEAETIFLLALCFSEAGCDKIEEYLKTENDNPLKVEQILSHLVEE